MSNRILQDGLSVGLHAACFPQNHQGHKYGAEVHATDNALLVKKNTNPAGPHAPFFGRSGFFFF